MLVGLTSYFFQSIYFSSFKSFINTKSRLNFIYSLNPSHVVKINVHILLALEEMDFITLKLT